MKYKIKNQKIFSDRAIIKKDIENKNKREAKRKRFGEKFIFFRKKTLEKSKLAKKDNPQSSRQSSKLVLKLCWKTWEFKLKTLLDSSVSDSPLSYGVDIKEREIN